MVVVGLDADRAVAELARLSGRDGQPATRRPVHAEGVAERIVEALDGGRPGT